MMGSEKQINYGIAGLLLVVAALCRLAPHPMNFTPMLAVALFGGATLPRRLAYAVPLAAMLVSDLALGYPFGWMNAVIYGCFLTGAWLGCRLGENRTPGRTFATVMAGSALFYFATNLAVWLGPPMLPPFDYPHTFAGLIKCDAMALPFFRNSLAGDFFWTLSLFGLFDLSRGWAVRHHSRLAGNLAA